MPVAEPTKTWPFSRDVNMREELIRSFLENPDTSAKKNPAALPSTLMDFGFWNMKLGNPTPVGALLKDEKISWQEAVLILLSKRPSSRDEVNIKPLVVVCRFLMHLHEIGMEVSLRKEDILPLSKIVAYDDLTDDVTSQIVSARHLGEFHTYCDIWFNALKETGLFEITKSDTGKRDKLIIANKQGAVDIIRFIAQNGMRISVTPPKTTDEVGRSKFYTYMGAIDTGIFEILPPRSFCSFYPNVGKIAFGLDMSKPKPPSQTDKSDYLSVALKVFRERRYGSEWQAKVMRDSFLNVFEFAKMTADEIAAMPIETFKVGVMDKVWAFQNGGARTWGQLDDDEKAAYQKFVAEMRGELKTLGTCFPTGDKCPRGMGHGVVSELLMRFYPDSCCSYNEALIWDALVALGMCEGEFDLPKKASVYQDFMGKCAVILRRMEEMKFGRTPKEGDKDPADYITVNEFFWFVHDYKDLIKEEVMIKEFKKVEKKLKSGQKKLSEAMQDPLTLRLAAALRTKPFAILAGHSGTGKSQMVRRLAYMTCIDEGLMAEANEGNAPGNYCMIQVKPNWHDSTDLLGYYSEIGKKYRTTDFVRFVMKAYAYPEVPFFVCLDEMNLAPVEQYFAEYLSALESASDKSGMRLTDPLLPKGYAADEVADSESCRLTESKAWYEAHGLTLPRNLFVVGTVNMDDTTCQFSRKVLDRAMTIMMDCVKFEDMMDQAKSVEPSANDLLAAADVAKFLEGKLRADPLTTHQVALLNAVEGVLGKTPFAVAYRFANEYALYEASLVALTGKTDDETLAKQAMDHCVLMKVLPRIHGEKKELENLFRGDGKGLEATLDKDNTLSGDKMEKILERKQAYLSFWP